MTVPFVDAKSVLAIEPQLFDAEIHTYSALNMYTSKPHELKVDHNKLEALHKRFQAFDSDSSSFIDSTELTPLLQSLGFNPTQERVQDILSAFDTDRTGTLTFGEFIEVQQMPEQISACFSCGYSLL